MILGQHERTEGCIIKRWPPDPGSGRVLLAGEAGDALEYYRHSVEDILRHVQTCSEQMRFFAQ